MVPVSLLSSIHCCFYLKLRCDWWLWKLKWGIGAGRYKTRPWKHEGLTRSGGRKKEPAALQHFVDILSGDELNWSWGERRGITSGLGRKESACLCSDGLWAQLGDNNSPCGRLPPPGCTLLALLPPLDSLLLILFTFISSPPNIYLFPSPPSSLSSFHSHPGVTYIFYSAENIILNTCGKKKTGSSFFKTFFPKWFRWIGFHLLY